MDDLGHETIRDLGQVLASRRRGWAVGLPHGTGHTTVGSTGAAGPATDTAATPGGRDDARPTSACTKGRGDPRPFVFTARGAPGRYHCTRTPKRITRGATMPLMLLASLAVCSRRRASTVLTFDRLKMSTLGTIFAVPNVNALSTRKSTM